MNLIPNHTIDTCYWGYANYETWNIALYIANDEYLYQLAIKTKSYSEFCKQARLAGRLQTGDGIRWGNRKVNKQELDQLIKELA